MQVIVGQPCSWSAHFRRSCGLKIRDHNLRAVYGKPKAVEHAKIAKGVNTRRTRLLLVRAQNSDQPSPKLNSAASSPEEAAASSGSGADTVKKEKTSPSLQDKVSRFFERLSGKHHSHKQDTRGTAEEIEEAEISPETPLAESTASVSAAPIHDDSTAHPTSSSASPSSSNGSLQKGGVSDADIARAGVAAATSEATTQTEEAASEATGTIAGTNGEQLARSGSMSSISVNSWDPTNEATDEEWGGGPHKTSKKGYIVALFSVIGAAVMAALLFKGLHRSRAHLRSAAGYPSAVVIDAPHSASSHSQHSSKAVVQEPQHAGVLHNVHESDSVGEYEDGDGSWSDQSQASSHQQHESSSDAGTVQLGSYPVASEVEGAMDREAAGRGTAQDVEVLKEADRQVEEATRIVGELDPQGAGKMAQEEGGLQDQSRSSDSLEAHSAAALSHAPQQEREGAQQHTKTATKTAETEAKTETHKGEETVASTDQSEAAAFRDAPYRGLPMELWEPIDLPELPPLPTFDTPAVTEQIEQEASVMTQEHTLQALRQRAALASRSSAAAAQAAYRASSYSAAASSAASRAAEAANAAALAATRAYQAADSMAEHELTAAEARLEAALVASQKAEQQAAEAAAFSTANQDTANNLKNVAEQAAEVVPQETVSPSLISRMGDGLSHMRTRMSDMRYNMVNTAASAGHMLLGWITSVWLVIKGWAFRVRDCMVVVQAAHFLQTWFFRFFG